MVELRRDGRVHAAAGHLQVISNMVDFGMDSQGALDALRFQVVGDSVWLEGDVGAKW